MTRVYVKPEAIRHDDWEVNEARGAMALHRRADETLMADWQRWRADFDSELQRGRPGNFPFARMLAIEQELEARGLEKPKSLLRKQPALWETLEALVDHYDFDSGDDFKFDAATYIVRKVRAKGGWGFLLDEGQQKYLVVLDVEYSETDARAVLLHEVAELHLMFRQRWPKQRAHERAVQLEADWRKKVQDFELAHGKGNDGP